MISRRPRIKPAINLSAARKKPKADANSQPEDVAKAGIADSETKVKANDATTTHEEKIRTLNKNGTVVKAELRKYEDEIIGPFKFDEKDKNPKAEDSPKHNVRTPAIVPVTPRSSPRRVISFSTPPAPKKDRDKIQILSVQTVNVVPVEDISKLRAGCNCLPPKEEESKKENAIAPASEEEKTATTTAIPSFTEAFKNTSKAAVAAATFKRPAEIEPFHLNSTLSADANQRDVIQIDLQKPTPPPSPGAGVANNVRQRIRPMPIMTGQRRKSFVATSPSPHTATGGGGSTSGVEDNGDIPTPPFRRERHYSGSQISAQNFYHHPHKFTPTLGGGRVRTESNCSAYSDSHISFSNKSSRKNDDQNLQRQNSRREREERFKNGVNKADLKMCDLIYYNPPGNAMIKEVKPDRDKLSKENQPILFEQTEQPDEKNTQIAVPQLKLNELGEMIIDDQSLTIETTADREARKVLANTSVIYHHEMKHDQFSTRKKRTRDWSPEETLKFYVCLQRLGSDFSMMETLFKDRTRRDLKLKFKKEERINPTLIDKAMTQPRAFNMDELKLSLAKEEEKYKAKKCKKQGSDDEDNPPLRRKRSFSKRKPLRPIADGPLVDDLMTRTKPPPKNKKQTIKRTTKPAEPKPIENIAVRPNEKEKVGENSQITPLDILSSSKEYKESYDGSNFDYFSSTLKKALQPLVPNEEPQIINVELPTIQKQLKTEQMDEVFEHEIDELLQPPTKSIGDTPLAHYFGQILAKNKTATDKSIVISPAKFKKGEPKAVSSQIITTANDTFSVTVLNDKSTELSAKAFTPRRNTPKGNLSELNELASIEAEIFRRKKREKKERKRRFFIRKHKLMINLAKRQANAQENFLYESKRCRNRRLRSEKIKKLNLNFWNMSIDLTGEDLNQESLAKIRQIMRNCDEDGSNIDKMQRNQKKQENYATTTNLADDEDDDDDDLDDFLEEIGVSPETYNDEIEAELIENFGNTSQCRKIIAKIHERLDDMRAHNLIKNQQPEVEEFLHEQFEEETTEFEESFHDQFEVKPQQQEFEQPVIEQYEETTEERESEESFYEQYIETIHDPESVESFHDQHMETAQEPEQYEVKPQQPEIKKYFHEHYEATTQDEEMNKVFHEQFEVKPHHLEYEEFYKETTQEEEIEETYYDQCEVQTQQTEINECVYEQNNALIPPESPPECGYSFTHARYPLDTFSSYVKTTLGTLYVTDCDEMNPNKCFAGKTEEEVYAILPEYEFLITENPEQDDIYYEIYMVDKGNKCVSKYPLNFTQENLREFVTHDSHVRLLDQ